MKKFQDGRHWEQNAPKVLKLTIYPNYSFNNEDKINVQISLDSSLNSILVTFNKKQDFYLKKHKMC